MPEKLAHTWQEIRDALMTAALFSSIGISIGIGKLLIAQRERLSWRLIVGRRHPGLGACGTAARADRHRCRAGQPRHLRPGAPIDPYARRCFGCREK